MFAKLTALASLFSIVIAIACESDERDASPTADHATPVGSVSVNAFIQGFSEQDLECIERTVAPERLPQVIRAFVDNLDRGDSAETEDELAALAFYECTSDELTIARIVARARLAALPISEPPYGLRNANLPTDERQFDDVYARMPGRLRGLSKTRTGPTALAYYSDGARGSNGVTVQAFLLRGDPDFEQWTAADRLLLQVSLFTRYAERMEPATDGRMVWVTMTLTAESTVHRFTFTEADSSTWYMVEGESMESVLAVVQAFAESSR